MASVYFHGVADEHLSWLNDTERSNSAIQNIREIVRRLLMEGATHFFADMRSASGKVFVDIVESCKSVYPYTQLDVYTPAESADMAIIMPMENMPRDRDSVIISRMARQKGVELILYDDSDIYRAKAKHIADIVDG